MEIREMYEGIADSLPTSLTRPAAKGDSVIYVGDTGVFPDAPNIAVIGFDDEPETVVYTGKTENALTGVARGVEGTVGAWPVGTPIARNFTNADYAAIIGNIRTLADNAKQVRTLESAEGVKYRPVFGRKYNFANERIRGIDVKNAAATAPYQDLGPKGTDYFSNRIATEFGVVTPLDNRIVLLDKETLEIVGQTEAFETTAFTSFFYYNKSLYFYETQTYTIRRVSMPDMVVRASKVMNTPSGTSTANAPYRICATKNGLYYTDASKSYFLVRADLDTLAELAVMTAQTPAYYDLGGFAVTEEEALVLGGSNAVAVTWTLFGLDPLTLRTTRSMPLFTNRATTSTTGAIYDVPCIRAFNGNGILLEHTRKEYTTSTLSSTNYDICVYSPKTGAPLMGIVKGAAAASVKEAYATEDEIFVKFLSSTATSLVRARYKWNGTGFYQNAVSQVFAASPILTVLPETRFEDIIFNIASATATVANVYYAPPLSGTAALTEANVNLPAAGANPVCAVDDVLYFAVGTFLFAVKILNDICGYEMV